MTGSGMVAGVVLAAGEGRRFTDSGGTGPKQLVALGDETLVGRAVRVALAAGLAGVAVVEGATPLPTLAPEVVVLRNPRWAEGIATSVQVAVRWAASSGHDALVVGLADQPGVGVEAWRAVASAADDPPIAVATYDGRRGNPVRLARAVWDLLPEVGDEGARRLMRGRPELVAEVPCSGEPDDIDTVEDLERWS